MQSTSLSSSIPISLTLQQYTLPPRLRHPHYQGSRLFQYVLCGNDAVVTVDGTSVAMRHWEGLATQRWECVEKDGWLGFVSRASIDHDRGTYLGRDGNESLICSIPFHHAWEHFQVVLHEEGFALEMRKDDGLAFVGITAGGSGLKLLPKGTTWWGFTVIEGATGGQPSHAPSTRSLSIDAPQMKLVLHW